MSGFVVTKIFKDFPCVHRQWRAESHCRFFHGYCWEFRIDVTSKELTRERWVMDFGGFKNIRTWLKSYFDHTFLVGEDDPERVRFEQLDRDGVIQLRVLPDPGAEGVSQFISGGVNQILQEETVGRVWVHLVEVRQNEFNSVRFTP